MWQGIEKGIKQLSRINIYLVFILLLFVFLQGDVLGVLKQTFISIYSYGVDFIPMSLALGNYNPGEAFLTDWTYYYWAFWIAWAPFTGIFIARISKGRTLRELVIGVLLIPSLGTFFWFTTFGDAAFEQISTMSNYKGEFSNVFSSLFIFLSDYPLSGIVNALVIVLLVGFLVTSVDSAIYVLSMFTDKGKQTPKKSHRLIWSIAILFFSIAIILLGNVRPDIDVLVALQKLLILTSLPFSFLLLIMIAKYLRDQLKE